MNGEKVYTRLLIATTGMIWILMILHFFAMRFHLYWTFSWFDILMHGLGGIVVGLLAGAFFVRFVPIVLEHAVLFFILVLAGTFLLGFLWEALEFILDAYMKLPLHQPSVGDTMIDLVMDTLGGIIAGTFGLFIIKKYGNRY